MWNSFQVLTNQVSKISFHTFEDIDLRESHAKSHKSYIHCLPRNFNGFPMYFAQRSFTEMKSTFIKLQNECLPKDIGQVLLIAVAIDTAPVPEIIWRMDTALHSACILNEGWS